MTRTCTITVDIAPTLDITLPAAAMCLAAGGRMHPRHDSLGHTYTAVMLQPLRPPVSTLMHALCRTSQPHL